MSCNTPEVSKKLSEQITAAKDKLASLTADADKGIAAALGSLNGDLAAEKEKLTEKIGGMVPEVELPKANLQKDLTSMLESTDNPGEMAQKFAELKKNFGNAPGVNLDSILDGIGLDSAKLNEMDSKLADAISQGQGLIDQATGALDSVAGELVGAAKGGFDSIKNAIGASGDIAVPGVDLNAAKDAICGKVPNLDLDKDGEVVKKGLPATQPTEEAKKPVPKAETKAELDPEPTPQNTHITERQDLKQVHWNKLSLEDKLEYNDHRAKSRKTKQKLQKPIVKEQRKLAKAIKKTKRKGEPVDAADISRNKGLIGCWLWLQKDGKAVDLADPKLNFGLKVEAKALAEIEAEWIANFPSRKAMDQYMYGHADLSAYLLTNARHKWPPFSE